MVLYLLEVAEPFVIKLRLKLIVQISKFKTAFIIRYGKFVFYGSLNETSERLVVTEEVVKNHYAKVKVKVSCKWNNK